MTTYVLVAGAGHGAWAWRRVVEPIEKAGHRAMPVSLTGVAERVHLARDVGLQTHVQDVVSLLHYEELTDVVLVGHSYAGLVVREVADRVPHLVRSLVLLDGWASRDGESLLDRAPDWFADMMRASVIEHDGTSQLPPIDAALLGVADPQDKAWVESLLTTHPWKTFTDATQLSGAVDSIPCTQIRTIPGVGVPFDEWAAEFGWPCVSMETGHDAMIVQPLQLARHLLECGERSQRG
jgi:pimeloyl-ACP methyl ester carboxylesterase